MLHVLGLFIMSIDVQFCFRVGTVLWKCKPEQVRLRHSIKKPCQGLLSFLNGCCLADKAFWFLVLAHAHSYTNAFRHGMHMLTITQTFFSFFIS